MQRPWGPGGRFLTADEVTDIEKKGELPVAAMTTGTKEMVEGSEAASHSQEKLIWFINGAETDVGDRRSSTLSRHSCLKRLIKLRLRLQQDTHSAWFYQVEELS